MKTNTKFKRLITLLIVLAGCKMPNPAFHDIVTDTASGSGSGGELTDTGGDTSNTGNTDDPETETSFDTESSTTEMGTMSSSGTGSTTMDDTETGVDTMDTETGVDLCELHTDCMVGEELCGEAGECVACDLQQPVTCEYMVSKYDITGDVNCAQFRNPMTVGEYGQLVWMLIPERYKSCFPGYSYFDAVGFLLYAGNKELYEIWVDLDPNGELDPCLEEVITNHLMNLDVGVLGYLRDQLENPQIKGGLEEQYAYSYRVCGVDAGDHAMTDMDVLVAAGQDLCGPDLMAGDPAVTVVTHADIAGHSGSHPFQDGAAKILFNILATVEEEVDLRVNTLAEGLGDFCLVPKTELGTFTVVWPANKGPIANIKVFP